MTIDRYESGGGLEVVLPDPKVHYEFRRAMHELHEKIYELEREALMVLIAVNVREAMSQRRT